MITFIIADNMKTQGGKGVKAIYNKWSRILVCSMEKKIGLSETEEEILIYYFNSVIAEGIRFMIMLVIAIICNLWMYYVIMSIMLNVSVKSEA